MTDSPGLTARFAAGFAADDAADGEAVGLGDAHACVRTASVGAEGDVLGVVQ